LQQHLLAQQARQLSGLRWMDTWLQVLAGVATLGLLARFIQSEWGQWPFVMPALAMVIWTVWVTAGVLRRYVTTDRQRLDQPVLAQQRQLAGLRLQRLRALRWAFFTGHVVWAMPLLVVLARGLWGVDLYAQAPGLLAAVLAASVLALPAWWALAHGLPAAWRASRFWQGLADHLAGQDVVATRQFLASLQSFEQAPD
jgi:hypothetical protein